MGTWWRSSGLRPRAVLGLILLSVSPLPGLPMVRPCSLDTVTTSSVSGRYLLPVPGNPAPPQPQLSHPSTRYWVLPPLYTRKYRDTQRELVGVLVSPLHSPQPPPLSAGIQWCRVNSSLWAGERGPRPAAVSGGCGCDFFQINRRAH